MRRESQPATGNPLEPLEPRALFSAGHLDSAFGAGGGVVTIDAPDATSEQVHFIGKQGAAGKLIVGGSVGDQLALWRLNADGSPDASFGANGRALFTVPQFFANGSAAFAVDPAGGRIAAANSIANLGESNKLHLRLFTADGAPDTGFGGGDGILDLNFADRDNWVGFQSDGKLIVAGGAELSFSQSTHLTRLHSGGSTDTTFGDGNDGNIVISHGSAFEIAPDDRIVVGMTSFRPETGQHTDHYLPSRYDVDLARLTADGALDTSFAGDGVVHIADDEGESGLPRPIAADFAVGADGDVHLLWVLPGTGGARSQNRVSSFTAQGNAGGGLTGVLPFAASADFLASDFGFDPDGRITVTGAVGQSTNSGRFVARFLADGAVDRLYADAGTFTVPEEYIEPGTLHGLVLPDGRALLAASLGNVPDHSIAIQQLTGGAGDAADVTLNRRGTLIVNTNNSAEHAQLYLRGRDGRLIVRVGNDFARSFAPSRVKRIALYLHGGADTLTIGNGVRGAYCDAGDGADTLRGGQLGDVLLGAAGNDALYGLDGNDTLLGGDGDDYLLGGAAKDDLFGEAGADKLNGAGGNDRLFGGTGFDLLLGGAGTDAGVDDGPDALTDIETLFV